MPTASSLGNLNEPQNFVQRASQSSGEAVSRAHGFSPSSATCSWGATAPRHSMPQVPHSQKGSHCTHSMQRSSKNHPGSKYPQRQAAGCPRGWLWGPCRQQHPCRQSSHMGRREHTRIHGGSSLPQSQGAGAAPHRSAEPALHLPGERWNKHALIYTRILPFANAILPGRKLTEGKGVSAPYRAPPAPAPRPHPAPHSPQQLSHQHHTPQDRGAAQLRTLPLTPGWVQNPLALAEGSETLPSCAPQFPPCVLALP